MRHFYIPIEESFRNGIKPEFETPRNQPYLTSAMNVMMGEQGLEIYDGITDPFAVNELASNEIYYSHPFPQLFQGSQQTLIATQDDVFQVTQAEGGWTIEPITYVNYRDWNDTSIVPTPNSTWNLVDLKSAYYMFNGKSTVMKLNLQPFTQQENLVLVSNDVHINTGCYHRGRVMIGGFDPDHFWTDRWESVLDYWRYDLGANIFLQQEMKSNMVMWSSIGGGDFPMWLFFPRFAVYGSLEEGFSEKYNEDNPYFLDVMDRNEFGWMTMDWGGTVLKTKSLGKNVIVYGDNGITALYLAGNTYGKENLTSYGIQCRCSVGGDDRRHLFIDAEGNLRRITQDLQIEKLGYAYIFEPMLDEVIRISHDYINDRFYISGESRTFVFSNNALFEIDDHITSLVEYDDGLVGISQGIGTEEIFIETNDFDLQERGMKTVQAIQIGTNSPDNFFASIGVRYDKTAGFTFSREVPFSPGGAAYPIGAGVDFRVKIRANSLLVRTIDYITIEYMMTDNRFRRGVKVDAR